MRVIVVPYDPSWPSTFQILKANLENILSKITYISIEHVGSTSVPSLCAKPIFDVDIVVSKDSDVIHVTDCLATHGYQYQGDGGIAGRHMLRAPDRNPSRNVYICVDGCLALRNHLAVRDILREDNMLRGEYARLKMELSEREWTHLGEYVEAKSSVLQKILQQAGIDAEERESISRVNKGL
jgi:GrpB-like predicted nucleotidyltransferase (UPF0157 family)